MSNETAGSAQMREADATATVRLTTAQAIVRFLGAQHSERDGIRRRVVPAVFGIFGHGNVASFSQALDELGDGLPYYQPKNEQAMVHAAIGFARANDRLSVLACTSSIGPGATNMITGAATATVNRIPVLLFPSDTFANRRQGPVLQQLEHPTEGDLTVSDCFRPVSRFFDRITRPEQLLTSLPEAIRVLLDPAETGAVTLTVHQDVQGEAFDFPLRFFEERTWHVVRRAPQPTELEAAAALLAAAERPLLIAGGGVRYSGAGQELADFANRFGVPVAETFAGKSATPEAELLLGGIGVTGTQSAYEIASRADVVLCVGTRLADFATGSHSIFQHPEVRFVAVNVNAADAYKVGAAPVVADAREALGELAAALTAKGWETSEGYREEVREARDAWRRQLDADLEPRPGEMLTQGQVLRALNDASRAGDAVVAAAGSPPGDLLRSWDSANGSACFLEFGFSCMGHEIPAGLGLRLGRPEGEIFVAIGDGTYLMSNTELFTAVQEGLKITLVLIENHGYQCIRELQVGKAGVDFGNEFRSRQGDRLAGPYVAPDFAANVASFGVEVFEADDLDGLRAAFDGARAAPGPAAVICRVEPHRALVGSETWWDVGVAQASGLESTRAAAEEHLSTATARQRFLY
ncbi:MAG: 3D-(3,5/4)-trihydroxycyclohexane-1,2-dione acylhydrolase (decyclizing) [Solirubrobacterales bacterium]